jgi:hypothetical protein
MRVSPFDQICVGNVEWYTAGVLDIGTPRKKTENAWSQSMPSLFELPPNMRITSSKTCFFNGEHDDTALDCGVFFNFSVKPLNPKIS